MQQIERIIFFGTPLFAATILEQLIQQNRPIVAVVTAPDKAAGRGLKAHTSAVKQVAEKYNLPILQPEKLKAEDFNQALKAYNADLQIVIAFRMLPEQVWNMPKLGSMNLHASILPNYRGAAPINWAIINGETETGLSTFLLQHEIDTGNIIQQVKIPILLEDNAGSLHDKMMLAGADIVGQSIDLINQGNYELKPQAEGEFPHAPKLNNDNCLIHWDLPALKVHNQIRGLSPYPGAYCIHKDKNIKLHKSKMTSVSSLSPGKFEMANKHQLLIHCADFCLEIIELQVEGKKKMNATEFLNGFQSLI